MAAGRFACTRDRRPRGRWPEQARRSRLVPAMTRMKGRTAIVTEPPAAWAARRRCSLRTRAPRSWPVAAARSAGTRSWRRSAPRAAGPRLWPVMWAFPTPIDVGGNVRPAFGGVDTIVCFAGTLGLGSVTDVPPDTWRQTMAVNLDAVFYLLRSGLPAMRARGGGSVVIGGSIAALKAFPNHAAYCASKGALLALVRQVAVDYGPAIRINVLCPGPVDTPLIWDSASAFPDPSRAVSDVAQKTLMKRLGLPDDIARAALFLASDESGWVTGTSLTIDGGIMTGA